MYFIIYTKLDIYKVYYYNVNFFLLHVVQSCADRLKSEIEHFGFPPVSPEVSKIASKRVFEPGLHNETQLRS